jgi:hypothetical protein
MWILTLIVPGILVRILIRLLTSFLPRCLARVVARLMPRLLAHILLQVLTPILARVRIDSVRWLAALAHRLDAAREHRAADRLRNAAPAAAGHVARLPAPAPKPSE